MIGKVGEADPFWQWLQALHARRKRGGKVDDPIGQPWSSPIRQRVLSFLQDAVQAKATP